VTSLLLTPAHGPETVAATRRRLVEALTAAGVAESLTRDAELAAGELLANAAVHGRALPDGTIRVEARWSRHRVRVAVRDGGCATGFGPPEQPPPPGATSGVGLWLASRVGRVTVRCSGPAQTMVTVSIPR
jgi:anti-sigma regulatory factor (Ser/Thr protein kinase)